MQTYVIRRVLLIIPTLLLVTIIVFLTVRLIPGSVVDSMLAEQAQHMEGATYEAAREGLEHKLGLDLPIHVQYWEWISGVFQGDLGRSLWTNEPVTQQIFQRLPVSLELGIFGIIIGLLIAMPVGIYSAIRQDTKGDYIARSFAIACIALPAFWVATMVMVFPSIWWRWSPAMQYIPFIDDPLGNLKQFIIPAFILGMGLSGTTMRMIRTMMLEVLRQDYIRSAWSKGLRERTVVIRHALKNALIPVVTLVGMHIAYVIGSAVILEQIFALPGMGSLLIHVIQVRDYTVLSGLNLFMASFVLVLNLLVDLTYSYLDPRIRYR